MKANNKFLTPVSLVFEWERGRVLFTCYRSVVFQWVL